ncbi:ATP-binding protein [Psychrobacter lutiphocae]|uniref:ATP-binding protein n=1 Tax=Psychrobacter lutiphocae TaxID=540500 RepID=UPI000364E6D7|nr:DUF87 domain-containing protein [Psychrobacter lutiphocae]
MLSEKIHELASGNIFEDGKKENLFVGRPFYLDYDKAQILIADAWKHRVNGIPQGSFLLAFYEGEDGIEEAILLRALRPSKLPSDNDIVSTMIEYYKEGRPIQGRAGSDTKSKLDDFTRYEFSFSGLECRVLGTYYKTKNDKDGDVIEFGADLENFYSANNYKVYKASEDVLFNIVNQREGKNIAGGENESKIGSVRFSSSRRFQNLENNVDVFISPKDFIGKRTALFGMTRTGKSNTVKKIIEATEEISSKAPCKLQDSTQSQEPFEEGKPSFPVGQIIFDVNGEYANANLQDDGTAIFELFEDKVTRYSVLEKDGFKVMKVNFYEDIKTGFELIKNYFEANRVSGDYINNFTAVSLEEPKSDNKHGSEWKRYNRIKAAYLCCLYKAGFTPPNSKKVYFAGNVDINNFENEDGEGLDGLDPTKGLTLDQASTWFTKTWKLYKQNPFFNTYEKKKGYEWADDDLKSMMIFLSTFKAPDEKNSVSGYKKLRNEDLLQLHTTKSDKSFELEIPELLRKGEIVIVDLSQGSPVVQKLFSERICRSVFNDSMSNFVKNKNNNFIQFYFEEAHNLFPKKDEKDLTDVYNRLAKEGAKLNIGMTYATQEVSSISANILKNTQNWFIAHLNNDDEMKELKKYYDFSDFTDSLLRFSSNNDKGFVRMKTYTNPFVVPVQVDRFLANRKGD